MLPSVAPAYPSGSGPVRQRTSTSPVRPAVCLSDTISLGLGVEREPDRLRLEEILVGYHKSQNQTSPIEVMEAVSCILVETGDFRE